jgi:NAD(P)H-dependent FMN reductase
MALTLTLLFGSYRRDRLGIRVARFVESRLRDRGHDVQLIDAQEVGLPILDRMYKEYPKGEAPDVLEQLAVRYRASDAFVLVTGEYNHGVQPGLKNLLDHFLEEYFWRPSAIVSYSAGVYGGARAAVHLRETLGELGMPSISSVLSIGKAASVIAEDGSLLDSAWNRRVDRFAGELEWYAEALRDRRAKGVPY